MTFASATFKPKSEFLSIMLERGFVADCTDIQALDEQLIENEPLTAFAGFDATAASLHVGHLLSIMMLRWWQKTGNRPIILMGGGTTKVGDPSFRSDERPMLSEEQIDANIASLSKVFNQFISFETPEDALMLNNAEWLDNLNFLSFLRDIGRHFSVNRMLAFDSVKSRLDEGKSLSFLEFNYMIMQAFDFLELKRRHECVLQIGGSDQWGNIVNGIELTRRVDGAEVMGLTSPLLTTSDGKKMGKSANGAVWLSGDMLSPFEFWQFWRNTDDADVKRFLKLFTELPVTECERLGDLTGSSINEAKIILAREITTLLHGEDAARAAEETAKAVFERGEVGDDLPTVILTREEITGGLGLSQILVRAGLAKSGKEAKRLIMDGGVRLNDAQAGEGSPILRQVLDGPVKLSAGRKRHVVLSVG